MKIVRLLRATLGAAFVAGALAGNAAAAQPTSNDTLDRLIDELNALLDKGERERLADPRYLRELRDSVGKYHYPWRRELLHDDFAGQGPTPGAPWRVTEGEFVVDWRYGLRSVVEPKAMPQAAPVQESQQPPAPSSTEDATKALLGAILQGAIGSQQSRSEPEQQSAPEPTPEPTPDKAIVEAEVPITNAFALEIDLTARSLSVSAPQHLQLGPYQGRGETRAGYRLILNPQSTPGVILLSISSSGGSAVIETYQGELGFADNQPHKLSWTRDTGGSMLVSLDGTDLLSTKDRRFQDPFDGLIVINGGGDYALREIKIEGTR